jgi:hypothetical protein
MSANFEPFFRHLHGIVFAEEDDFASWTRLRGFDEQRRFVRPVTEVGIRFGRLKLSERSFP